MKDQVTPSTVVASKGALIAQASRSVMDKTDRILLFVGLLLVSWAMTWEKTAVYALTPTISSMFQSNNISGVLTTVLSILQTALNPVYSKTSDMVGRAGAYTFSIVLFIVSYIVMACSQNYNTLIGGQVIYAFGYSGTYVLGKIIIGDVTVITNRSISLALYNFPTIINLFAASAAAQRILNSGQWRWGYGHICIVMFVTSAPIITALWRIERKAKQAGVLDQLKQEQGMIEEKRTFMQKVIYVANEIDVIGSILLVACLFLILLPLIMANNWGGWHTGKVYGTLIAGGCTLILFGIWEWKFSVKPIIPLTDWESKNPMWGCLVVFLLAVINNIMDFQYFLTYLQVTRHVNSQMASYLERGFNVAFVCLPLGIGYLMKKTRRWRPYVWVGAVLSVLGPGLMIPARNSNQPKGFIVIAQIIFGAATAFIDYPITVGMQASVDRKDVAIVIALFELATSVAASIGTTISGAVWNGVLPGLFEKYVPGEYSYSKIVKSISYANSLPADQLAGVVRAYDEAMRLLGIISVCIGAAAFLCCIPLKGFILEDKDESKEDDDTRTLSERHVVDHENMAHPNHMNGPAPDKLQIEPSVHPSMRSIEKH